MPLSRDSKTERRVKAIRRAQYALKQRLERIDWEEEVLFPEIERLKSGKSVMGIADDLVFDIVIEPAPPKTPVTPVSNEDSNPHE